MNGYKSTNNYYIKLFTVLLTAIWLTAGIYYLYRYDLKTGISVIAFGLAFLTVFKLVQRYSLKMLSKYNKNLNDKGR